MAEFGENSGSSPSNSGDTTTVPSDETAGKTQCEGSVLNGDCGIMPDMVVSGFVFLPDSQGQETANNTSLALDAKSGIPRRSSIIKVYRMYSFAYNRMRRMLSLYLSNLNVQQFQLDDMVLLETKLFNK